MVATTGLSSIGLDDDETEEEEGATSTGLGFTSSSTLEFVAS